MRAFILRVGSDRPIVLGSGRQVAAWWGVGWGTGQRERVGSGTEPESRVGLGCLEEFVDAGQCPRWSTRGQTQEGENLGNHCGIFNGRDEGQGARALRIGGNVDREDEFE